MKHWINFILFFLKRLLHNFSWILHLSATYGIHRCYFILGICHTILMIIQFFYLSVRVSLYAFTHVTLVHLSCPLSLHNASAQSF